MHCFANNLPTAWEKLRWEHAVTMGVGIKAGRIEHYNIVGTQDTTAVEVRLKVKGETDERSLKIAPETHGPSSAIAEAVRQAVSDL